MLLIRHMWNGASKSNTVLLSRIFDWSSEDTTEPAVNSFVSHEIHLDVAFHMHWIEFFLIEAARNDVSQGQLVNSKTGKLKTM